MTSVIAARALPCPLDPAAALPVPVTDQRLETPAMLIDLDIVDANIANMAAFAGRAGLRLRPHVKTHKSVAMARRQLAAGAAGLCVATVSEAEVFATAGEASTGLASTGLTSTGLTDLTLADRGRAQAQPARRGVPDRLGHAGRRLGGGHRWLP
jgi:D-serine deaminase-like pyridoxal phosphate-dependent protein